MSTNKQKLSFSIWVGLEKIFLLYPRCLSRGLRILGLWTVLLTPATGKRRMQKRNGIFFMEGTMQTCFNRPLRIFCALVKFAPQYGWNIADGALTHNQSFIPWPALPRVLSPIAHLWANHCQRLSASTQINNRSTRSHWYIKTRLWLVTYA